MVSETKASTPSGASTQALQKPPPPKKGQPTGDMVAKQPKTGIGARLDKSVKVYYPEKQKNRSSDLIPLTREFEVMRKKLQALIVAAKHYPAVLLEADKARLDLISKLSVVAAKSPIEPYFNEKGKDSLVTGMQNASKQVHVYNSKYTADVVDYCIEWNQVTTTRIDTTAEENRKLYEQLDHYQTKTEILRKKSHKRMEQIQQKEEKKASSNPIDSTKTTPAPKGMFAKRLSEKLQRNEDKLDAAWKKHEKSAADLCNLIEEVTAQGWNDLYPLLRNLMQWEIDRASTEYDIMAELAVVKEKLGKTVASEQAKRKTKGHPKPAAAATSGDEPEEEESETNWSSHSSSSTDSTTEEKKHHATTAKRVVNV